jgi:hypothetical protein
MLSTNYHHPLGPGFKARGCRYDHYTTQSKRSFPILCLQAPSFGPSQKCQPLQLLNWSQAVFGLGSGNETGSNMSFFDWALSADNGKSSDIIMLFHALP